MKRALPLGLVLLVGVALGLHRSPSPKPAGERQGPSRPAAAFEGGAVAADQPARRETREAPASEVPIRRDEAKPTAPAGSPASWRKLVAVVEREIVLTSFQHASVERVLRERDDEIQAWHQEMRRAGIIDLRHYDWQAGLMRESWYSRLDALMDRAQHELFVALVQKGFLNEGLDFTVEPGMTVLD